MKPQFVLTIAFALACGAAAPAQETPPAPTAPTVAPDREKIKQHWKELSPEERQRLKESYERWKTLTPEQKALLRKRHENLEEARRATDKLLPDDDRKKNEKLKAEARRKELTEQALKVVKERFDHLPPDVKARIKKELHDAPPGERAERMRALLRREIKPQIESALQQRVKRGDLTQEEVDTLAKRAHDAPTAERARLLREFMLAHPKAFPDAAELRKRARKNPDALDDLRMLEKLRHDRRKERAAPPPKPGEEQHRKV
jgi:hypothetical protein